MGVDFDKSNNEGDSVISTEQSKVKVMVSTDEELVMARAARVVV
ncbi:acetate/propionate family kinase [Oligella ureolytica]